MPSAIWARWTLRRCDTKTGHSSAAVTANGKWIRSNRRRLAKCIGRSTQPIRHFPAPIDEYKRRPLSDLNLADLNLDYVAPSIDGQSAGLRRSSTTSLMTAWGHQIPDEQESGGSPIGFKITIRGGTQAFRCLNQIQELAATTVGIGSLGPLPGFVNVVQRPLALEL